MSGLVGRLRAGALATSVVAAVTVAGAVVPARLASAGTTNAANKIVATASNAVVMQTQMNKGSTSQDYELLHGTLKASNPVDLISTVSLECALQTDVQTVGTASSTSTAEVDVWITIDGVKVPVTTTPPDPNDTSDPSHVTFCNRSFQLTTSGFTPAQMIGIFNSTKDSHSFQWVALNMGSYPGTPAGTTTHFIQVFAHLQADVTGTGTARAEVLKRIYTGDPANLLNTVSI